MSLSKSPKEDRSKWLQWLPKSMQKRMQRGTALRKIIENIGWLSIERVATLGLRFVVGVWVVRYLGPEQYGIYSYAISFVAIFGALSGMGLEKIVVRALARDDRLREQEVLTTGLWLRGAGGAVVFGLLAAVVFAFEDRGVAQAAILIVGVRFFVEPSQIFSYWFQSRVESRYAVYARSTALVVGTGLQALFIVLELSVTAFLLALLVQSTLEAAGLCVMFCVRNTTSLPLWPSWSAAKSMMSRAWPLIVSGLSTLVYMKIDQVMIARISGDADVGVYAAAAKLSEVWYFIPGAITTSVFPKIIQTLENCPPEVYQRRMQQMYDTMTIFAYAVILPITILAVPIIRVVFGESYLQSASILQVHVWSFLFMSLGLAQTKRLVAEDRTRLSMVLTVTGPLLNFWLNLVLNPMYGGHGAAWATILSYSVYAYLGLLLIPHTRKAFWQMTLSFVYPIRLLWLRLPVK